MGQRIEFACCIKDRTRIPKMPVPRCCTPALADCPVCAVKLSGRGLCTCGELSVASFGLLGQAKPNHKNISRVSKPGTTFQEPILEIKAREPANTESLEREMGCVGSKPEKYAVLGPLAQFLLATERNSLTWTRPQRREGPTTPDRFPPKSTFHLRA
jgi:hypothetical protein